tara:strand:+ start:5968 stop:6348 length:381 start_codon:yes stop_codon:yes gene_type:complete
MVKSIFIAGNVPSSKNSKQMIINNGRTFFVWSKTAQKYVRTTKKSYVSYAGIFKKHLEGLEKPYKISFKFIRGSKHKFDYPNPLQTIMDLMVKYEWIEDDNADEILPVFEFYEYSKEKPGVIIGIT